MHSNYAQIDLNIQVQNFEVDPTMHSLPFGLFALSELLLRRVEV